MIIARFGNAWAGAYELGLIESVDSWQVSRPAVTAQMSGASGAFDFYGLTQDDPGYPISPLVVTKGFSLSASTYVGVESELNDLRENTIAAGAGKLWAHLRDGTGAAYLRYAMARCISLKEGEKSGGVNIVMPVELQFYCPEGVWYKNTGETQVEGSTGTHTITNDGNYPALLYVLVSIASGTCTQVVVSNSTNGSDWTYDGSITSQLIVDAKSYICTEDGADAYSGLTIGSDQVTWLWLSPGSNSVNFSMTGGSLTSITYVWQDTYLL